MPPKTSRYYTSHLLNQTNLLLHYKLDYLYKHWFYKPTEQYFWLNFANNKTKRTIEKDILKPTAT